MKIYLSNYWRKSSIFIVCLSAIITVATAVFCIQSYDEEDYILIIGALFFVILSFCLQLNALKLLDYVEVSNNQFIMCSVSGKRKCTINSDTLIYYQIVSLIEGTFSRTDFIVLSDQSFPCYQNGNGLAKVCKEINAKEIKLLCLTIKCQNRYCVLGTGIRLINSCYSSKRRIWIATYSFLG